MVDRTEQLHRVGVRNLVDPDLDDLGRAAIDGALQNQVVAINKRRAKVHGLVARGQGARGAARRIGVEGGDEADVGDAAPLLVGAEIECERAANVRSVAVLVASEEVALEQHLGGLVGDHRTVVLDLDGDGAGGGAVRVRHRVVEDHRLVDAGFRIVLIEIARDVVVDLLVLDEPDLVGGVIAEHDEDKLNLFLTIERRAVDDIVTGTEKEDVLRAVIAAGGEAAGSASLGVEGKTLAVADSQRPQSLTDRARLTTEKTFDGACRG